jgi:hypothetical protein
MHTTLNKIRKHRPCEDGWEKLLKGLGKIKADDEPLLFSDILRINGFQDALWTLRCAPREYDNKVGLFNVSVARRVQHLMKDQRSIDALDVAEKYAKGEVTKEELSSAMAATKAAAKAAWAKAWESAAGAAERAAAEASAEAAWTAVWATGEAAWSAKAAANNAAEAATKAAWAAAWTAGAGAGAGAAWEAADDMERKWQKEQFLKLVNGD